MRTLHPPTAKRGSNHHEQVIPGVAVEEAFECVRDVARWPCFMPAVRSARFATAPAKGPDDVETVHITAAANGQVHEWYSSRMVDPIGRTVRFVRLQPVAPLLEMRGSWLLEPSDDGVRVSLEHYVVTSDQDSLDFFLRACRSNAAADLDGLARHLLSPADRR